MQCSRYSDAIVTTLSLRCGFIDGDVSPCRVNQHFGAFTLFVGVVKELGDDRTVYIADEHARVGDAVEEGVLF